MAKRAQAYKLIVALALLVFLDAAANEALALGGNPEFKDFNKPQLAYSVAHQKWLLIADSDMVAIPLDLKPIPVKHVHDLCAQLKKLKIQGNQVEIVWGAGGGIWNALSTVFKPGKYDCDFFPVPMRLWLLKMEYPYTKYKTWGEAQDLHPPKLTLLPCDYPPGSINFFTYITGKKTRKFIAFPYGGDGQACLETFGELRAIAAKNWGAYYSKVSLVEEVNGSTFRVVRLYDLTKN